MTVKIGNAPVSFGIFEPSFGETKQLPYEVVLKAIADAGYEGTELGPYGYYPTDAQQLDALLKEHQLTLGSSFVPVDLANPECLEQAVKEVLEVATLLSTQQVPEVIIADLGDEYRLQEAGSGSARGWTEQQWGHAAKAFEVIGKELQSALGMKIVVHHHAGTYLETPEEIDRLMSVTDPEVVSLLLDTGHYAYGGGDPVALFEQQHKRIPYLHFKDIDLSILAKVKQNKTHYHTAVREQVFVPLNEGNIDFPKIAETMKRIDYDGWVIVEQDTVAHDDGTLEPDPMVKIAESRDYLKTLGF